MRELAQLTANGLVTGSILALAAIGLSLVYGILKIVNFAHGEYLTFGVFVAFVANVTLGWNMAMAAIAAIVLTALLGIALEFVLWRPLRHRQAGLVSLLITSIGLALVLRHVVFLGFGSSNRRYDVDVFQVYELGLIRLSAAQLVAIGIAVVSLVLVGLMLARTRLGKAMRALSDDRSLAAVAGIDTDRVTAATWIVGAGLAGLGGVLLGLVQTAFNPNMGFSMLLPIFAAVILGGIGSAYGALAGGFAIGLVMEVSTWSGFAGGVPPVYSTAVAFAVLVVLLIFRPQGVLGKARTL